MLNSCQEQEDQEAYEEQTHSSQEAAKDDAMSQELSYFDQLVETIETEKEPNQSYFCLFSLYFMFCSICSKPTICIQCCGQSFCLMDFFGSLHKNHYEKAKITNTEQFNKDIGVCKRVGFVFE